MGFHHVSNEIYYPNSNSFKICDDSGEDSACSNSNWTDLNVHDHSSYMNYDATI